jgi:two-component system phosphate regulon sensor histidine kinase PhoR
MKPRRLFWLVYPSYVLLAVLSLLAVAWVTFRGIRQAYEGWTEKELRAVAILVAEGLRSPGSREAEALATACRTASLATGYRFTLIQPSGVVAADSEHDPATMDNHAERPEIATAFAGLPGQSVRYSDTLRRPMMYVAVPVTVGGEAVLVVRASQSLEAIEAALGAIRRQIALAAAGFVAVAALLSLWISRRVSRPLENLHRWAGRAAAGDLEGRLPSSGIAEIRTLSDTMTRMAAQLTERIRTITQQRDEQAALFACMVEGVLAVDGHQRLLKVNRAAADLLQIDAAQAVGRGVLEVIRNVDLHDVIERALASDEPAEGSVFLPERDRHLQAHGAALKDAAGARVGAVIVLNDVTRLRKLETMRRDFVANVSHELKTPITSIRGFADTLIEGGADKPEDRERFLRIIQKQSARLQAIVEDLLALSSLEHGAEENAIELIEGEVGVVLTSVVRACQPAADAKSIRLVLESESGLKARLNVQLLEQAVSNLIDNAVKYSEESTQVRVSARVEGQEIAIRVKDQGPGISKEHLPRIFERFYRVDKGRSRKLGGTGLGLAIVKHVALAHGGRVSVESRVGEGSVFSIVIPRARNGSPQVGDRVNGES